jgi:RNA polymerase sigma-70 factor (ECF subfamily)
MEPQVIKLDDLLDNAAWVHGLARQLLADSGAADDVVQETWIAALQAREREGGLRPWLARVARNFALQRRRSDAARAVRERVTARPERTPSTSEVVGRAELHVKLVAAVLALEEPHRSTILWRYFDELAPEEIARRAGIELATVRSRLKRARERLREDLIAQGGTPPEQWLAALLPLAPRLATAGTSLGVIGGIAMSTKIAAIGAAAVLLAVVGWWAWTERSVEFANAPANARGVEDVVLTGAENSAPSTDPASEARAEVASAAKSGSAASVHATLHGTVLGEDGHRPLAGARISHRRGSEIDFSSDKKASPDDKRPIETRADDAGRFEIEAPNEVSVGLWFEFEGYLPLKLAFEDLPRDVDRDIEAVLAPLGSIDVRVVDEEGQPAPRVSVGYQIQADRGSNDQRWSFRREMAASDLTDSEGRVTLDRIPCGMPVFFYAGSDKTVSDPSGGSVVIDVGTRRATHEIRLPRRVELRARLVDAAGRPIPDTLVLWQCYPRSTNGYVRRGYTTDVEGKVVLRSLAAGPGELTVEIPGVEPIQLTLAAGEQRDLGDIVLGKLLPLSGKVVSAIAPFDGSLDLQVFRGGRQLCRLRPEHDGSFATRVTGGELSLLVTRGGNWQNGDRPTEVLASLALAEPATNLVLTLDARFGAACASVEGVAVPPDERVELLAWRRETGGSSGLQFVASTSVEPPGDGRVAIGPLEPGRYVLSSRIAGIGSAFSGEFVVAAGVVSDAGQLDFRNGAIAGRVVDAAGNAVAKAILRARAGDTRAQALSDNDGRFRFDELTPGVYEVGVKHAEAGVAKLESIVVTAQATTEITVPIQAFATVQGIVRGPQGPVAGGEMFLQPYGSNDDWNTTTDAEGRFRFDKLPPGRLRAWMSGQFLYIVDVAPGETRELDVEIGSRASVRFTVDGVALEGLTHVAARLGERWNMGVLVDGRVEIESSSGPALFTIDTDRLAANESYVAVAPRVSGSMEVELSRREIALDHDGAWQGPLPTATLVSIGHGAVIGRGGDRIGLAIERTSDGRVRVPHVPEGAVVELAGIDSKGRQVGRTVDASAESITHVLWP